jgi:hypothetical protein
MSVVLSNNNSGLLLYKIPICDIYIMICRLGDTPRKGNRGLKKDGSKITSRIIGVEAHCGPVHGTMLYYTDNVVAGGANIIIEIMRQGEQ